MPPAHRVGDKALNPADAHGCPACPHPVQGPGTSGSPDVFVNHMPQMRVGDPGMHVACCGPNSWTVAEGSKSVFVNGIPPSRIGDATTHCGGSGKVIQGSPNVIIGDYTCAPPPPPPPLPPDIPNLIEVFPKEARFFVNLADDEGRKHGRKVTVKARVDPPQAGVPIFFKLLDVPGNATEALEAGTEAKMLTQQATTDGNGVATADMLLSSNAGDMGQVRASTEPDGQGTAVDSGVQAVWRKLKYDVINMVKPEGEQPWGAGWLKGKKTYSLDDDLARATEGFKRVFIDFEDSGKRYEGAYKAMLRVEEVLDWCKAACPPGPPQGEAPVIHMAVVPRIVASSMFSRTPSMGGGHGKQGTHQGGGVYHFELDDPPYFEDDRIITFADVVPNTPWFRAEGMTGMKPGVENFPNSIDDPGMADIVTRWLVPQPVGELGTKEITIDLSQALPARLRPNGQFPETVTMNSFYYAKISDGVAGICLEGGQYVIMTESLDGDATLHEIGHALGLAAPTKDNDGINHCKLTSCVMFYADQPGQNQDFHGGPNPPEGSCAYWLRRLNMTKEHLYQRWWTNAGWPDTMAMSDADGCPCIPPKK